MPSVFVTKRGAGWEKSISQKLLGITCAWISFASLSQSLQKDMALLSAPANRDERKVSALTQGKEMGADRGKSICSARHVGYTAATALAWFIRRA
jgi:hypothetical protein